MEPEERELLEQYRRELRKWREVIALQSRGPGPAAERDLLEWSVARLTGLTECRGAGAVVGQSATALVVYADTTMSAPEVRSMDAEWQEERDMALEWARRGSGKAGLLAVEVTPVWRHLLPGRRGPILVAATSDVGSASFSCLALWDSPLTAFAAIARNSLESMVQEVALRIQSIRLQEQRPRVALDVSRIVADLLETTGTRPGVSAAQIRPLLSDKVIAVLPSETPDSVLRDALFGVLEVVAGYAIGRVLAIETRDLGNWAEVCFSWDGRGMPAERALAVNSPSYQPGLDWDDVQRLISARTALSEIRGRLKVVFGASGNSVYVHLPACP